LEIAKNAAEKLIPMHEEKEQPPKFKEETYKITFLDHTIIKFERLQENISQD
jgi:hypothetical protein